ncbi:hypothetical protein OENI_60002 [Oenococcus oeni]|nr:hypothetical protein OENI_60002 [Oenococcus oeni]SYW13708.1 hypothetical protein OENI_1390001 [Oenococcus oeni]SYW17051.1 hypothetical protein OENI_80002 [Oenococcus oeni]SYW20826.1 hypothetical protein OENI_770014 [Oenococcus oeni]
MINLVVIISVIGSRLLEIHRLEGILTIYVSLLIGKDS